MIPTIICGGGWWLVDDDDLICFLALTDIAYFYVLLQSDQYIHTLPLGEGRRAKRAIMNATCHV